MRPPWLNDHAKFRAILAEGKKVELAIAADLFLAGYGVTLGPDDPRNNAPDQPDFVEQPDILVTAYGGQTICLEVKGRDLDYTGPDDYPYDDAFIDSPRAWKAKPVTPDFAILVSKATGGRLVLPGATSGEWTARRVWDTVRRQQVAVSCAPRSCFRSWEWLLENLPTPNIGSDNAA